MVLNDDGTLYKASIAEWIHISTEGGVHIPNTLLRDLSAIVISHTSKTGIHGKLTGTVGAYHEHLVDTHPHALSMEEYKSDIVRELYLEYRTQGYPGTEDDMLRALLQIIPLATAHDVHMNDDTKAVPVHTGRLVIDPHDSDLNSHRDLLLRGTPDNVLLSPPTISIYGKYLDMVHYDQYKKGARFEIDELDGIWSKDGGTLVISYETAVDDEDYVSIINAEGSDVLRIGKFKDFLSVATPGYIGYDSLWHVPHEVDIRRKIAVSYCNDGITILSNVGRRVFVRKTLNMDARMVKMSLEWISKYMSSFVYYPFYISDNSLLTDLIN